MRQKVSLFEKDGQKYYYVDLGNKLSGNSNLRLWISHRFVQEKNGEYYVFITGRNKTITKTKKGTLVLKPAENNYVFHIGWKCGYRGESWYKIKNQEDVILLLPYELWITKNGVGKTKKDIVGISRYAIVVSSNPRLIVTLSRNGKPYENIVEQMMEYHIVGDKQIRSEVSIENLNKLEVHNLKHMMNDIFQKIKEKFK